MGSTQNYEVSYRCMAYLMTLVPITAAIKVVPYVGIILSFAIVIFYIVVVSTEVHGIPVRKALQVFGIISVVLTILLLSREYSDRNRYATPEQVRKAMEETAKQYQKFLEEAKARKEAERNR